MGMGLGRMNMNEYFFDLRLIVYFGDRDIRTSTPALVGYVLL